MALFQINGKNHFFHIFVLFSNLVTFFIKVFLGKKYKNISVLHVDPPNFLVKEHIVHFNYY